MDSLPEEVLIEIFLFLPSSDLLQLTAVSSYFYELINNSPFLVKKFTLYLKKSLEVWPGRSRFCSNLVIYKYVSYRHRGILEEVGEKIHSLKIRKCSWSIDTQGFLSEIFRLCPNLKRIRFERLRFDFQSLWLLKKDEWPRYENLVLEFQETDARIFKIFRYCTAKRLEYDYQPIKKHVFESMRPFGGPYSVPDLVEFLQRQENLEDLALVGFYDFMDDRSATAISKVKFRLKKLCLRKSPLIGTIHFNKFLRLHANSLLHLEIDGIVLWDFSRFVAECKNLTHLKIGKRDRQYSTQKSIEKLTIVGNVDKSYFAIYPNLKYLNVTKLTVTRNVFDEHFDGDKIEELVINKSWLGGFFKFEALKKIHFKEIQVLSAEIFQVNRQLEEIIFENCPALSSDIIQKINEYCENLKMLVVK